MATPGQLKLEGRLNDIEKRVSLLYEAFESLNGMMEYYHGNGKESDTESVKQAFEQGDESAYQDRQGFSGGSDDAGPVSVRRTEGMEQGAAPQRRRKYHRRVQRRRRETVQSEAQVCAGGPEQQGDETGLRGPEREG